MVSAKGGSNAPVKYGVLVEEHYVYTEKASERGFNATTDDGGDSANITYNEHLDSISGATGGREEIIMGTTCSKVTENDGKSCPLTTVANNVKRKHSPDN